MTCAYAPADIAVEVFVKQNEVIPVAIGLFEFELVLSMAAVLLDQLRVRKFGLQIFVEIVHVRVRRGAVEVEGVFLNVLAVVAFVSCQSKQTLFEDRITLIPQRRRKKNNWATTGDTRQSILVPTVSSGTGMIV